MGDDAGKLIAAVEAELLPLEPEPGRPSPPAPGELTPSEEGLVSDVHARGGATLNADAVVRSTVIRSICLHPDLVASGRLGVLSVKGGKVEGALDLSGLSLDLALRFEDTEFQGKIVLKDTRLVSLELHGGRAPGISADRAAILHDLVIGDGFTCGGAVWMRSAGIGGDLNCMGASFIAAEGEPSLQLDGVHVGGRFFARARDKKRPFHANRGVYARNARIDRGILAPGGRFDRELDLTRATVQGVVNLSKATIGGEMTAETERFRTALRLDGLHTTGDLDLREAQVGANRIVLRRAKVEGRLAWDVRRLSSEVSPPLIVNLNQARVGTLDDEELDCWDGVEVVLSGFSFDAIAIPREEKWRERRRKGGPLPWPSWLWSGLQWLNRQPAWLWRRLEWLNQQPEGRWTPFAYDQTRTALANSGEEAAARETAIARERARRDRGGLGWLERQANRIYATVLGYGYKPLRFLGVSALIVFVFFLAYAIGLDACDPSVKNATCGSFAVPELGAPPFRALMFSLDAFVPVDLHQTGAWIPSGAVFSYVVALETALGWLLTGLLLGGVTGILRRD